MLAVVLIIVAVLLILWSALVTGGATLTLLGFVLTPTTALIVAAVCITGAFLVDKETAGKTVGKIGEAASDAVEAVGGAVGDVAGGLLSGLASSPVVLGVAAVAAAYFLLNSGGATKPNDVTVKGKVSDKSDSDVIVGSIDGEDMLWLS